MGGATNWRDFDKDRFPTLKGTPWEKTSLWLNEESKEHMKVVEHLMAIMLQ